MATVHAYVRLELTCRKPIDIILDRLMFSEVKGRFIPA